MPDEPQSRNERSEESELQESAPPSEKSPETQCASDNQGTKAGTEPRTDEKPHIEVRDEIPRPRFGPAGEEIRDVTPGDRRRINRRELLELAPIALLGAFAIPKFQQPLLNTGLHVSDWTAAKLFGPRRLEPTYSNSEVASFDKFPYNFYDVVDPGVDLASWTLTVEGLVKRPGNYTLQQIQALPKVTQNTRHVCVEGWDVVGNFGGVRGSDFLRWVGADLTARFLEVECADEYYESIDMETMLHPQTIFCYEMYGRPLDRGHGAPLGLRMPTKLGYKQAKYLTTVRVTNVLKPGMKGYWEDQGYDWYGGL
jgi:DMSO/TMAO reductase YedYZ molybdopterin-dependent catalytic subunit